MATKRILELVGRATANISLKKTNPSVRFTGFTSDGITGEIVLYAARGVGFAQITDTACRAIAGEDYIMDSGDDERAVPVPAEDRQETIALRPVTSEKAVKDATDVHPGTGIIRKEDGHVAVDNSEDARNGPYVNRILKKLVSAAESRSRKHPTNPYPASGSASTESGRAPDMPGAPVADTNPQVMQQIEVNANPEKVGIIPNDAHVQVRRQRRGAGGKRSSRKISSSSGRPLRKSLEAKSSSGPREAGEQEGHTAEPARGNRTDRHEN
jgi:putative membrane protein